MTWATTSSAATTSRQVSVTDKAGHPVVLDKWGRLIRPLQRRGHLGHRRAACDAVERLLDDLHDAAGVPAFIAYGTLLGAVRNGRLIGHDNDVDLAYVSRKPFPVDVVREGFAVERALRDGRLGGAPRLGCPAQRPPPP